MIKEIKGDLLELALEGHFDYIVHGCNCFCRMGSGIAAQIASKFPEAQMADNNTRRGSVNKLGSYEIVPIIAYKFYIINAYTQFQPGANFNLSALDLILYKLHHNLPQKRRIGFPLIGAGIGGGKWKENKAAIVKWLSEHHVTIVHYEQNIGTSKKNIPSKRISRV